MRATRQPVYGPDPEQNCWVLKLPLKVDTPERTFCIEASFQSDIASIPRILWTFVGPPATPRIDRAAWLHDWLYAKGPMMCSRREADRYFLMLMREDGAESPWLKWLAVRCFGWWAWHKARKRDK